MHYTADRQENADNRLPALARNGFDYSSLDPVGAASARSAAERIRKRTYDSYIENGRDLIAVKAELGHGAFGCWLRAELKMSERSAQNLMAAAELVDTKSANIADLPVTAIYRLAAPSTPECVRDQIIARVERGEALALRDVTAAIADGKQRDAAAKKERERLERLSPQSQQRRKRDAARRKAERDREEARQREQAAESVRMANEAVELLVDALQSRFPRFKDLVSRAGYWRIQEALAAVEWVEPETEIAA